MYIFKKILISQLVREVVFDFCIGVYTLYSYTTASKAKN